MSDMIFSAAIKDPQGMIHTRGPGWSHSGITGALLMDDLPFDAKTWIDGFVTESGIFMDRKEAAAHAYKIGQIKEPVEELTSTHLKVVL